MFLISYITLAWLSHTVFAELAVRKTISLFAHFIWKWFRNNKQLYDAILMQSIFFLSSLLLYNTVPLISSPQIWYQSTHKKCKHSQHFILLGYQTLWGITELYKQRNRLFLYMSNVSIEMNQIHLDWLLPSNSPPYRGKWKLCHVEYKSTRKKKSWDWWDDISSKLNVKPYMNKVAN